MKIDKDKIYQKWKPILDSLGVTEEERAKMLAEYSEMHKENENKNISDLDSKFNLDMPLLPHAIRVSATTIINKDK